VAVTDVVVESVMPFAGGTPFGAAGVHELVDGIVRFAVDPAAAGNARIVDLEHADRGRDGLVHFQSDFRIVRPADRRVPLRRLLFVVAKRGITGGLPFANSAPQLRTGGSDLAAGDGLVLRRGWSVAWCGWQWDVDRTLPGTVGLDAPTARRNGQPISGQVRVEFRTDGPIREHRLSDSVLALRFTAYPAADLDDPEAVLSVRDWPDGPRRAIERSRWRFARDDGSGRPIGDDTSIWMEEGFEANRFYEVVYRTRACPVVGTGLLAARDFVSYLRHARAIDGDPCRDGVSRTIAYGASQSARFLRQLVYEGANVDELGRPVFDGIPAWSRPACSCPAMSNWPWSGQPVAGTSSSRRPADRRQVLVRTGRRPGAHGSNRAAKTVIHTYGAAPGAASPTGMEMTKIMAVDPERHSPSRTRAGLTEGDSSRRRWLRIHSPVNKLAAMAIAAA
jgi:hypothetical protein